MKSAHEFEQRLGGGVSLIFEGHPKYCAVAVEHNAHWHSYAYLDQHGEAWFGRYICDGDPAEFAPRPDPEGGST